MFDLSKAGEPTVGGLIPDGELVIFQVEVRPHNAQNGTVLKPWGQGKGVDMVLRVVGGAYNKRVLFETAKVEDPEGKGVEAGWAALKALLEADAALTGRPLVYTVPNWQALSGKLGAGRVRVEKGEGDYKDKNRLGTWISPSAASTRRAWAEVAALYGLVPGVPYMVGAQQPGAGHPVHAAAYGAQAPQMPYAAPPQQAYAPNGAGQAPGYPYQPQATGQAPVSPQTGVTPAQAYQPPPGVQATAPLPWGAPQPPSPHHAPQANGAQAGPAGWPGQQ